MPREPRSDASGGLIENRFGCVATQPDIFVPELASIGRQHPQPSSRGGVNDSTSSLTFLWVCSRHNYRDPRRSRWCLGLRRRIPDTGSAYRRAIASATSVAPNGLGARARQVQDRYRSWPMPRRWVFRRSERFGHRHGRPSHPMQSHPARRYRVRQSHIVSSRSRTSRCSY